MAGLITANANALLDYLVRNQSYSQLSTLHIGLYSTMPDDAGAGGVELSGTGYARKSIASSIWDAAASRKIKNTAQIEFTAGAGAAWGTSIGFGLFAASSGGTPLWKGTTDPLVITNGLAVIFAAGYFELEFT